MELPRDGEYRHTLHVSEQGARVTGYVIRMHHPEREQQPRTGTRYNLAGSYASKQEAHSEGVRLVRMIVAGDANAANESLSENVGDYKLRAGAAARTDIDGWEPTLSIKSRKPENKGAIQEFNSTQSALRQNTFPEASSAAKFALTYGRRVVRKEISGLNI